MAGGAVLGKAGGAWAPRRNSTSDAQLADSQTVASMSGGAHSAGAGPQTCSALPDRRLRRGPHRLGKRPGLAQVRVDAQDGLLADGARLARNAVAHLVLEADHLLAHFEHAGMHLDHF